jgi:tryptophan 2,3-dioxygenase
MKSKINPAQKANQAELLDILHARYERDGLSLDDHLEGLIHHSGVNYTDYIAADTLLTLQRPLTQFHDEMIFITFHQICELHFKLCLHEVNRLVNRHPNALTYGAGGYDAYIRNPDNWITAFKRLGYHFAILNPAMDIMLTDHMSQQEFGQFRLSLLPASGFQTVQLRMMEILMTGLVHLSNRDKADVVSLPLAAQYQQIYWKTGGIQDAKESGGEPRKSKTLQDFEARYDADTLLPLAQKYEGKTIYDLYHTYRADIGGSQALIDSMAAFDRAVNDTWKGAHLKVISTQIGKREQAGASDKGTGGTNWRKYLPPAIQKVKYFPALSTGWEHTAFHF